MLTRLEQSIAFATYELFHKLETKTPPDAFIKDGVDTPDRHIYVSDSIKRHKSWLLKLTMQRQMSPKLAGLRMYGDQPQWMPVVNDDGLWMGVAITNETIRASYITHVQPFLWMDTIRTSLVRGSHVDITNELSEPSTLFLQNCIAESNALRKNSPKPSRRLGGFDWLYFDDKKHRQSPPWDTHARDLAWLQRKAPSFFLHERFGVAVWGHFTPHLLIRHKQTIFLWKIPTAFRRVMIGNAKERDIFVPTRVLPQRADKANKVLHIVDN